MQTPSAPWLNTAEYSGLELTLFLVGCAGWVVEYAGVLWTLRHRRFVEIPAAAVAANVAWEFVWGFLFPNQLGLLFTWGYRIWFFIDLFIVYNIYRWGRRQLVRPALDAWFAPAMTFGIVAWGVALYYFVAQGYDTGYGAISGYVLNVMMSALYITLILGHDDIRDFSAIVAWSKMLGTALLSVFNLMVQTQNTFLLILCGVTLILDLVYIGAYHSRAGAVRRAPRTAPAVAAAPA
jgi:hypothetical protein